MMMNGPTHSEQRGTSPHTDLPYRVRRMGRITNERMHSTLGTHHGDAMLTLVIGGRGHYVSKDDRLPVLPAMVGIVLPTSDVGILMADKDDPYDHFYCRFAGSEAIRAAQRISDAHGRRPFFEWTAWQELAEGFQQLLTEQHPPDEELPERVRPADARLAYLLSQLEGEPPRIDHRITAERLERYMRENLSTPASLDTMAQHFAVSKAHLCRVAKPLLGDTILCTWQAMKMDWAGVLLRSGLFAVSETAHRVGFEDPFYFSRVFKAHTGISPRDFRESVNR